MVLLNNKNTQSEISNVACVVNTALYGSTTDVDAKGG